MIRSGLRVGRCAVPTAILAVCVFAVMLLIAPPEGRADNGQQVIGDRAGDAIHTSGGVADIRRVIVDMPNPRRIRFDVRFAAETPDRYLFVNLMVGTAMFQVRGDSLYRVRTFDIEGGSPRRVGPVARVARGNRAVVAVSPALIGSPPAIRWMVEALEGIMPNDRVPDRGFSAYRLPHQPLAIRVPAWSSPGGAGLIVATGFQPNTRLSLHLQPTFGRGGNGFGIAIRRPFMTDSTGRSVMRFPFPRGYLTCLGSNCRAHPWRTNMRVDVNVCTTRGTLTCVRKVTRVR